MAHERILQLEHEIRVAHRLHEANIQSLTADLNAAFIDADKKKESGGFRRATRHSRKRTQNNPTSPSKNTAESKPL